MYTRSILLYLGALAWLTQGAPLNINLGAYSPALVVGDGEISFGVSKLQDTILTALRSKFFHL